MDQPALWLSTNILAVKMAAALWAAQLGTIALTRGQGSLGRSLLFSALSMVAALQAWRFEVYSTSASTTELPTTGGLITPASLWLLAALVSAALLIDCLRRWMVSRDRTASTGLEAKSERFSTSGLLLSIVGLAVSLAAAAQSHGVPSPITSAGASPLVSAFGLQRLALAQLLCLVSLLGVTLAGTWELTLGRTGAALVAQSWRPLAYVAAVALLGQLAISLMVMMKVQAADTIEAAIVPMLYAFGLASVGYIAWAIPSRLSRLAVGNQPLRDQVSLAVSGWIAVLCMTLAAALP